MNERDLGRVLLEELARVVGAVPGRAELQDRAERDEANETGDRFLHWNLRGGVDCFAASAFAPFAGS